MKKNCTPVATQMNLLRVEWADWPTQILHLSGPHSAQDSRPAKSFTLEMIVNASAVHRNPRSTRPALFIPAQENRPSPCLLSSHDLWRHQADVIHVRRMADVNDFGDVSEVHVIVALDEHDALRAIGIDLG